MTPEQFEARIVGLKPKYQEQFRKIYQSNETFTGDFNLMAFLFGGIWGLSKGRWLLSIVTFVAGFFTVGFGIVLFWIYFGVKGTHLYYKYYIKGEQAIF